MNELLINKMQKKKKSIQHYSAVIGLVVGVGFLPSTANAADEDMTYLEEMGKRLFFEKISLQRNMSCSTCHSAGTGGTNGDSNINLEDVAVTGSDGAMVGNLKPPTNKYAQFLNEVGDPEGLKLFDVACPGFAPAPCGGAFWNGRAEGDLIETVHNIDVFAGLNSKYETMYKKYLGPVADQAHASPFINPLEQAKDDKFKVCTQVRGTTWGRQLYQYAWGEHLYCSYRQVDEIFARFSVALAAWQMSSDNNRFDSKRDIALKNDYDGLFPLDDFTDQENEGHDLFYTPQFRGGASCLFCHQSGNDNGVGEFERYTNDGYFNIGVPRNHKIPNDPAPDVGLFATTSQENHRGEHKVPTLRNVDKRPSPSFVKAYTHNGWFKSLEQLVHFYNTATVKATCSNEYITAEQAIAEDCWPTPEISDNFAGFAVGDLGLDDDQEAALVSYLKTLTDTTSVEPPSVYLPYTYDKNRLEHNSEESPQQETSIYDYSGSTISRYLR